MVTSTKQSDGTPYARTTSQEMLRIFHLFESIRVEAQEREMPAQLVLTFLFIASHDGCAQASLPEAIKMSPSSVCRNVKWLSGHHRLAHRSGLNWIRQVQDTKNYKAKRLFLSEEGQSLVYRLERKGLL